MLITFEGIDGSGKSTLIRLVGEYLHSKNYDYIVTQEPFNLAIRDMIKSGSFNSFAELALFMADRAQHLEKVIMPNISKRTIVLCDRYIDSTIAYQFGGNGLDLTFIRSLNKAFTFGVKPTRTYYLDLPVSEAMKRIAIRKNEDYDKYDKQSYEFYSNIQVGYKQAIRFEPERFCILNAHQTIDEVLKDTINDLDTVLRGDK